MRRSTILIAAMFTVGAAPTWAQTVFKQVDETMLVASQISIADVATAKRQGVTLIVNNRPDGEEPGQVTAAQIGVAARAAGLSYVHIPVGHNGISPVQINAMSAALARSKGKTLAFCRTGTRAIRAWSLARAKAGESPVELQRKAANAGYDLTSIAPQLAQVAQTPSRQK